MLESGAFVDLWELRDGRNKVCQRAKGQGGLFRSLVSTRSPEEEHEVRMIFWAEGTVNQ